MYSHSDIERAIEAQKRKFKEQYELAIKNMQIHIETAEEIPQDNAAVSVGMCCVCIRAIQEMSYKHFLKHKIFPTKDYRELKLTFKDLETDFESNGIILNNVKPIFDNVYKALKTLQPFEEPFMKEIQEVANRDYPTPLTL